MKNYLKLTDLKNIFFFKINKLNIHLQQYGGSNINIELEKYKNYNDNLEIINKQIYLLLTIKYIEYLIELVKSLDGTSKNDVINKIKAKINSIKDSKVEKLPSMLLSFIGYDIVNTYKYKEKINEINNSTIFLGLDTNNNTNNNANNKLKQMENKLSIYNQHMEDELNKYKEYNDKLSKIIINNKTKIKDIINDDTEKKKIIIDKIENKFNYLLILIKFILTEINILKKEHLKLFNNLKIFKYCNNSIYTNANINNEINEICKLCDSINNFKDFL
jgi:hypothetical protein